MQMAKADVMAAKAYVSLYVKMDAFTRGLKQASAKLRAFGSEMTAVGMQMGAMSAGALAPLAIGAKTFANFDDAMRMVKAVTQSTEAEFTALASTAKKLGASTSFTAVEVALLMTELGRAGFTAGQIDVMTAAVMDMARATGTDAALSAGIMSASIRQFGLDATDAARVADVLTTAANSTFNTVEGLGESLKYAGPVAKNLGLSLEDTVAILGSLGNVGIQGSEAGTALRRLGVITAATGAELKAAFGIDNVDAAGNLKPLIQIMDEIGKAVENMPVEERTTKMAEAFGLLGITSANVLSGAATETENLAEKLRNAEGAAAKAAKEMDSGVGGSFRIIMSAVEGVFIALGEAIAEPLKKVTDFGSNFLSVMVGVIGKNKGIIVSFGKIAAIVAGVSAAILGIGLTLTAISVALGGFAAAITFASSVMAGIGILIGAILSPVGLLVVALGAAAIAWTTFTSSGQTAVSTLVGSVSTLFGNLSTTFSETFSGIKDALKSGNLALAGQIAMTGLKLVFMQSLEAINGLFGETIGTIIGQLMSGDFSGALGTVGSVILDTWAQITSGLVGLMTEATRAIADKWAETVNAISNKILEMASQGGVVGGLFEAVSGVNMQEEAARAQRLEAQRQAMGFAPQTDDIASQIAAGTYQSPEVEAIRQRIIAIADEIDAGRPAITDATGQAVIDATAGQSDATSQRVRDLQAELARLRGEAVQQSKEVGVGGTGKPGEAAGATDDKSAASGMSGPTSAVTNNLMELQSAFVGPQEKQLKVAEQQLKTERQQLEKMDEQIAATRESTLRFP